MAISEQLLEIWEHKENGYLPLVDYQNWRVAVLNYSDEYLPENLMNMQRHDETDEVFVLLRGRCILFIGEGKERVTNIYCEDMQPFKLYNVKKAVWHTHTLSRDAQVLIVENRDTTYNNSPFCDLKDEQKAQIMEFAQSLMLAPK